MAQRLNYVSRNLYEYGGPNPPRPMPRVGIISIYKCTLQPPLLLNATATEVQPVALVTWDRDAGTKENRRRGNECQ